MATHIASTSERAPAASSCATSCAPTATPRRKATSASMPRHAKQASPACAGLCQMPDGGKGAWVSGSGPAGPPDFQ